MAISINKWKLKSNVYFNVQPFVDEKGMSDWHAVICLCWWCYDICIMSQCQPQTHTSGFMTSGGSTRSGDLLSQTIAFQSFPINGPGKMFVPSWTLLDTRLNWGNLPVFLQHTLVRCDIAVGNGSFIDYSPDLPDKDDDFHNYLKLLEGISSTNPLMFTAGRNRSPRWSLKRMMLDEHKSLFGR